MRATACASVVDAPLMAIDEQLAAQILRYYFVEHWRVGTIARQLGVHHSSVERVLREAGVEHQQGKTYSTHACSVPSA